MAMDRNSTNSSNANTATTRSTMITQEKLQQIKEPAKMEKPRKGSATTTLKSFNNNVSKLITLKMVTPDEGQQLKTLQKTIFQRWVSVEMGILEESGETTK